MRGHHEKTLLVSLLTCIVMGCSMSTTPETSKNAESAVCTNDCTSIQGTIIQAVTSHSPIANATITLLRQDVDAVMSREPIVVSTATSDSIGNYSLLFSKDSTSYRDYYYYITSTKTGFLKQEMSSWTWSESDTTLMIDITMFKEVSIEFTLHDFHPTAESDYFYVHFSCLYNDSLWTMPYIQDDSGENFSMAFQNAQQNFDQVTYTYPTCGNTQTVITKTVWLAGDHTSSQDTLTIPVGTTEKYDVYYDLDDL